MCAKYTIDRNESDSVSENAIQKIMRELGDRATIRGREIEVDSSYESRVVEILNRQNVKYSRE